MLRNANFITCNSDLTWNGALGALRCRLEWCVTLSLTHPTFPTTFATFARYSIYIPYGDVAKMQLTIRSSKM
jgi:hypothetical protein